MTLGLLRGWTIFRANERGCPVEQCRRAGRAEVLKFGATSGGGADAGVAEPAVLGVPVMAYGKAANKRLPIMANHTYMSAYHLTQG